MRFCGIPVLSGAKHPVVQDVYKRQVYAYTYRQLAQTAGKRLFNLKDKLTTHYQALIEKDYLSEILEEPRQMKLKLAE